MIEERLTPVDDDDETQRDFDERIVSIVDQIERASPTATRGGVQIGNFSPSEAILTGVGDNRVFPCLPITDTPFLDVKALGMGDDGELHFHRHRAIRPRDVRGKVSRLRRFIVEVTHADLGTTGKYQSGRRHYGSHDGLRWDVLDPTVIDDGRDALLRTMDLEMDVSKNVQLACGMQFRHPYDWHVVLSAKSAGLSLATDPIGAREAFALRDIPEGRSRRVALRNWVRSHWRKRRPVDANEMARVREHLRGATAFSWYGLSCSVHVSKFDLDRNDSLRDGIEISPACSCGRRCDARWFKNALPASSIGAVKAAMVERLSRGKKRAGGALVADALKALSKPCAPGPVFPKKQHGQHGCQQHHAGLWLCEILVPLMNTKGFRVGFRDFTDWNEASDYWSEFCDEYYDRIEYYAE